MNELIKSQFVTLKVHFQMVLKFQTNLEAVNRDESIAIDAVETSYQIKTKAIIVVTSSMGRTVAKFRPSCPIIVVTMNRQVARQLHLNRGIYPLLYHSGKELDEILMLNTR